MQVIFGAFNDRRKPLHNRFFMDGIGGEPGLDEFIENARQETAQACPFCGNEAAARLGLASACLYVRIICTKCGITTQPYFTGTNIIGKSYTATECMNKALTVWNTRQA